MMKLRSVLFVDFDNIFGGLMELDRIAGLSFAREPARWVERLGTYGLADERERRFLQCRAYLNPAGWISDKELGNDAGRLYLQKFRPNLTRAGFEAIDCPTLTLGQKNAADIRIVIDVLSSLDSDSPFDEFVIASSDADFTPLLHRLRARDRRIVVISAGNAAPSYHSVADDFIGPEVLISILLDPSADAGPATSAQAITPSTLTDTSLREAAEHCVSDRLAQSDAPLYLAQVGKLLRSNLGDTIDRTSWFGHGGLTAFLRSVDDGRLGVDQVFVWDPERHEAPGDGGEGANQSSLPEFVRDLRAATELPSLPSAAWPPLFGALADHAQREEFSLTACTASVRDVLKETDTPVSRGAVSFVVRGLSWQGVRLDDQPPPSADAMREAFQAGIIDRYEASGLMLDDAQLGMVDRWFKGLGEMP
jgi:NYN domain